jgi:hypothetical protein
MTVPGGTPPSGPLGLAPWAPTDGMPCLNDRLSDDPTPCGASRSFSLS